MKTIKILVLFLITLQITLAQDRFPTVPYSYNVPNYGNIQINASTAPFAQTEIIRGW